MMKKWIMRLSMLLAICILGIGLLVLVHAGFSPKAGYNLETPAQTGTAADLVSQNIKSIQPAGASDNAARLLFHPTQTTIVLIPGTGRSINHSIIPVLSVVAVLGFGLAFLGFFLRK
jgi:hypothetical protein